MRGCLTRLRRLRAAVADVTAEATVRPIKRMTRWALFRCMFWRHRNCNSAQNSSPKRRPKLRCSDDEGDEAEEAPLLSDSLLRRRRNASAADGDTSDSDSAPSAPEAEPEQPRCVHPRLYWSDVLWLVVVITTGFVLRAAIGAFRTKWFPVHHSLIFNDICTYKQVSTPYRPYRFRVCHEPVTIHQIKPLYELGSGAIGRVFAAEHLPTGAVIAVKIEAVRNLWDRRAVQHETSVARYVRRQLASQGRLEEAVMFPRPLFTSLISPDDAVWLGARIDAADEGASFDMDSDPEFWLRQMKHRSTKEMRDVFESGSDDNDSRDSLWWRRRGFPTEAADAKKFAVIGFELGTLGSLWDQRRAVCSWFDGDVGEQRKAKQAAGQEVADVPFPESMALMTNGTSREERVFRWLSARLTAALDALHSLGIVHRDVKAANIFVAPNGRIMLGDLSNAVYSDSYWQRFGRTGGTRKYFSPEQWRIKWLAYNTWQRWIPWKSYEVGPASDFWSLGVALWRMRNYCISRRAEYPFRFVDSPMSREKSSQLTALGLPAYPPYSWQRSQQQVDSNYRRPMWKFVTSMLKRDPKRRPHSRERLCRNPYLRHEDFPRKFCEVETGPPPPPTTYRRGAKKGTRLPAQPAKAKATDTTAETGTAGGTVTTKTAETAGDKEGVKAGPGPQR